MRKVRLLKLGLGCGLVLVAAAGCGGSSKDNAGSSGSQTTTASTSSSATASVSGASTASTRTDQGSGDYYTQLAGVINDADRKTFAISRQYGGPYSNTTDEIAQATEAFTQIRQISASMLASLGELDPPAAAEAAHQAYVDSVRSATTLFGDAVNALDGVSTQAELTAFNDRFGSMLSTASAENEEKCLVLQDLATSASSGADLGCSVQD